LAPLIVVLRLLHVLPAIFWVGGSLLVHGHVLPTAKRLGPDAVKFMQSLVTDSRMSLALTISGWIATVAGAILFVFVSGRFDHGWMTSPTGLTFQVGALFGIAGLGVGASIQAPNASRLAALSREIAGAGGPPTPAQVARMNLLRDKLERGGRIASVLLIIAAAAMAVARYV
jgi:hypothetical protein